MPTFSIHKDKEGPDWPLGNIVVATPGTPQGIMSLVDSGSVNDPTTLAGPGPSTSDEYTVRAYGIIFVACKAGASHGVQPNAGAIYIVRKGLGSGANNAGNRDDLGSLVYVLPAGGAVGSAGTTEFPTFTLLAAPLNRNAFSPYRYFIDADNANDGCSVTLLIE